MSIDWTDESNPYHYDQTSNYNEAEADPAETGSSTLQRPSKPPPRAPAPPPSRPVNNSRSYMNHKQKRNLTCRAAIMDSEEVNASLSSQELMESNSKPKPPPRVPRPQPKPLVPTTPPPRKPPPRAPPRAKNSDNSINSFATIRPSNKATQQLLSSSTPSSRPPPPPLNRPPPSLPVRRLSLSSSSPNPPNPSDLSPQENETKASFQGASAGGPSPWSKSPSSSASSQHPRARIELSSARNGMTIGSPSAASGLSMTSPPSSSSSSSTISLSASAPSVIQTTPEDEENLSSFQQSSLKTLRQLSKMPVVSLE